MAWQGFFMTIEFKFAGWMLHFASENATPTPVRFYKLRLVRDLRRGAAR
jgi:hypothetical protein